MPSSRRSIRPLPELLVNQIAAGEVVDRPASVVKELVENALDAGATRVTVRLEQGGIELVEVSDNGAGIAAEELPLALMPHATSKIAAAEDLDRIGTLGFRGEALASIGSVARVTIRSRTEAQHEAAEIACDGGETSVPRPASGPVGTTARVRNLFFNTPARRKFLRTVPTEQARCVDAARDLALAHPAVAFVVSTDGRTALDLPPGQTPRERALAALGTELADQVIEVSADEFDDARGATLWGLAGLPAIARATNQAQHVFLNGRPIRDKTVQHAIKEAYRGLIEPGRHPTCVLMIEMSPAAVDVNVHPAKVEVRFRDPSLVHTLVLRALRRALQSADLTPTIATARPTMLGPREIGPAATLADRLRHGPWPDSGAPIDYAATREALASAENGPVDGGRGSASGWPDAASIAEPKPQTPLPAPIPASRVLQVHNSYLVTQDAEGVVIVDQHALHERVMFEQLVARVSREPLERQRLLTPSVVPATPAQIARLPELAPLLSRIGVEAEAIGPEAIGVHAFPSFLFERGVDPVDLMSDLLERSNDFAPDSEEALRDVLDMMACKAAVKAGDRMSEGELAELLTLRDEVERSSNCPHGRPTSVRLTIRELERLFKRS
ncbi:MAG: DNA mismatch repair endonuclease MutL [Phycisphaerae bacterium]|nr:DNA mismatch repair endonuclease MutL [Phycisphaerae bacterium]